MPHRNHERISYHRLSVLAPFRLDLTVSALRRLSTNIVDQLTPDGEYLRALDGAHGPVLVRVRQHHPDALNITVKGDAGKDLRVPALLRRILGVDRDLRPFERAAARIRWLRPLAARMRGLKPPRYPTLWEACVNVVVFQQISLKAASTIVRRLIELLGTGIEIDGATLYTFPSVERVLAAEDAHLRGVGLSASKLATLRRVGEALASGALAEEMLEEQPTPEAVKLLQQFKGIGPWSATVILLRGLGRLDLFPLSDTSVKSNLALVAGARSRNITRDLEALGPQRGMLYYHLLLARLEARGDLGRPSDGGGELVLTIGHSTRTVEALIELLQAQGVTDLVDVRTIPRSRHNPQFNQDALAKALRRAGIGYTLLEALGGLRKARPDSPNAGWRNASFRGYADYMQTPEFEAGLQALIELAAGRRVAIMCAEAVPWRCHRSLIADALTVRGIPVAHIIDAGHTRPHSLTPFARVHGVQITYPAARAA